MPGQFLQLAVGRSEEMISGQGVMAGSYMYENLFSKWNKTRKKKQQNISLFIDMDLPKGLPCEHAMGFVDRR